MRAFFCASQRIMSVEGGGGVVVFAVPGLRLWGRWEVDSVVVRFV
jgi:hypothetical protein